MTTVVVGGGLAGLVAARHLAEAGHDVTVYERKPTVGGRVRSVHEDGFIFDRGFQVLFTAYPAVSTELDTDALNLRPFKPGATLARPGERKTLSDPFGDISAALESLVNRDVTFADKLRVLQLRRSLIRTPVGEILETDEATIETYLRECGFSERFLDNFVRPFYGGITLDRSLSTSELVFRYTFKMLSQGVTAVPAAGMGAVPEQLATRARETGATIETDTPVRAVSPDGAGITVEIEGETISADAAVVATDPKSARELTGVEEIPTEPRRCVTQYFSLPSHQQLPTGKRLLLNVDSERPNQVAPLSAVAPEYAPDELHLLSATFLGQQTQTDEQLASEVRAALTSWYPANDFSELELRRTDRIQFAQFAQPPGFRATLPAVDAPEGQVYLAGDYTEWSSIQGAMESGKRAATEVDRTLSTLG